MGALAEPWHGDFRNQCVGPIVITIAANHAGFMKQSIRVGCVKCPIQDLCTVS
jgi:hypothetical protein